MEHLFQASNVVAVLVYLGLFWVFSYNTHKELQTSGRQEFLIPQAVLTGLMWPLAMLVVSAICLSDAVKGKLRSTM